MALSMILNRLLLDLGIRLIGSRTTMLLGMQCYLVVYDVPRHNIEGETG